MSLDRLMQVLAAILAHAKAMHALRARRSSGGKRPRRFFLGRPG
jgi:hypothetical protein